MPNRKHAPSLKLLNGVDANELVETPTPQPAQREPDRPADLSVPERRIWDQVTDELRDMGTLAAADVHEITAYVQCVALAQRLHNELAKAQSLVVVNVDTGVRRAHPLLVAYDRTLGRAHVIGGSLGLNPYGRSLIHGRTERRANTEAAQVRDLYA